MNRTPSSTPSRTPCDSRTSSSSDLPVAKDITDVGHHLPPAPVITVTVACRSNENGPSEPASSSSQPPSRSSSGNRLLSMVDPLPSSSSSSSRNASGSSLSSTSQNKQIRLMSIFQSSADNQQCADCRVRLSESIWASVNLGVFVCIQCAGAHRQLGVQVSRVKSLQLDMWNDEEIASLQSSGGNKQANDRFAKHLDAWIQQDAKYQLQTITGDASARETFVRAKYQQKRFMQSPPSPCSVNPINSTDAKTERNASSSSDPPGSPTGVVEVGKRLINYFMVVGRGNLVANQTIENSMGPEDVHFVPVILDYYPEKNHPDSPLPHHIAQFAFSEGFRMSEKEIAPVFFSFVLTNIRGAKIYACALKFYEELHPLEVVSMLAPNARSNPSAASAGTVGAASVNGGQLPKWILDLSNAGSYGKTSSYSSSSVYSPKALVVTSHYPFYSAFRMFLQQVYRLSLSESRVPIERYICNFVLEVPLPPQGRIRVQLTLPDQKLILSRPCKNDFPLVDFSFRALFQLLDLNNVLSVFCCLALEYKVVLCSKSISLLTPVAETLLCLLLPFAWQGAYIPLLPSTLLDVFDAPVPYLVGAHANCLERVAGKIQNVVFVDLDHNRIIDALDEDNQPRPIPKLPEHHATKLRAKLQEFAAIFEPFAGEVTKADLAFPNDEDLEPIDSFVLEHGHTIRLDEESILSKPSFSENIGAFVKNKSSRNRKPSGSSSGTISFSSHPNVNNSSNSSNSFSSSSRMSSFASTSSWSNSGSATNLAGSAWQAVNKAARPSLSDSKWNETDNFSTLEIRKAFLRVFVSIFKKYANYLNAEGATSSNRVPLFDTEGFLRDNSDVASRPFLSQLLSTQMFERFCEDRVFNPTLSEVLFFDQSINQKLNRSRKIGKKKHDCSFLDDKSDEIKETFVAPAPSTIGLPDDGTIYRYNSFPRLKKNLFGYVRKPRELYTTTEQQRNASHADFHQKVYTLSRCIKGTQTSWQQTRTLVVKLQSHYRMFHHRKRFLEIRNAAITIKRWTMAHLRGREDRLHFLLWRYSATLIQKTFRMHRERCRYLRKRRAIRTIKHFMRGFVVFVQFKRLIRGIRRFQALWRQEIQRRQFLRIRSGVILIQCRLRGYLSRIRTRKWQQQLFTNLRRDLFDLWVQCEVSLLHRSKFWLTFNRPDFFTLGVHMEEQHRLKEYLLLRSPTNQSARTTSQRHDDSRPTKSHAHHRMSKPMRTLSHMMVYSKKTATHALEGLATRAGIIEGHHLENGHKMPLEHERNQLYHALKRNTTSAGRYAFYEKFKIPITSKRKKRTLAAMLWNEYDRADISAEVVVTVSSSASFAMTCSSTSLAYPPTGTPTLSPLQSPQQQVGSHGHPPNSQLQQCQEAVDNQKLLRLRDDLAFTVNAALKSMRNSHADLTPCSSFVMTSPGAIANANAASAASTSAYASSSSLAITARPRPSRALIKELREGATSSTSKGLQDTSTRGNNGKDKELKRQIHALTSEKQRLTEQLALAQQQLELISKQVAK